MESKIVELCRNFNQIKVQFWWHFVINHKISIRQIKAKTALNQTVKNLSAVISQLPTEKEADVSFNTKILVKFNEFIMK